MSISFLDLGAMHAELRPELDEVWQRVVDGSAFIGGEAVDRFEAVRTACTPRTAAVIAVHLYGQPVDMDAIRAVAGPAGIAVIEDAAQAHGAAWRGARAGSLGHVGCFSFYPGKNLGAFGDAGCVVTDDAELAQRIRCLANHGRPHGAAERHVLIGQNHRLDGLQAAILSVKLRRLGGWNSSRRRLARLYDEALRDLPLEPVSIQPEAVSSHHLMVVQAPHRDELRRLIAAEGIATSVHYAIPCHLQPACVAYATPPLPVVEHAAGRLLSLPMHPHLADQDIGRVASALARALDRLERRPSLA
jgi:dTDP-4-amino-4,6-dideoxygalactose transaminase